MVSIKLGMFATKSFFRSRYLALGVFVALPCAVVFSIALRSNTVCIVDGGEITYANTMVKGSATEILDAQGVALRSEDEISFTGFDGNYAEITIDRSFPVSVTADGETHNLYVVDGTVRDLLQQTEIEVSGQDWINCDLSKPLEKDDHVVINRVEYETKIVTEIIPHEVDVTPSSLLLKDVVSVIDAGEDGERERVLSEIYVDGSLFETNVVSEEITKEPVTEYQLKGTTESASPFEPFETVQLDETGRPANYAYVLENQVATAYSARAGARTASGRAAITGHVAVNPNVIPYGSRLFIETANGSFVYGYAVAADTGLALMDGRVDVDLFFDTYQESVWFGKRMVNIYVLP